MSPSSRVGAWDHSDDLERFRRTFERSFLRASGAEWSYWRGGEAEDPVLWLTGALGVGEFAFLPALALAPHFKLLLPDYPTVPSLRSIVEGLVSLLDEEVVDAAHVVGASFGGMLAQHFARACPERVRSLVLSHTTGPRPSILRAAAMRAVSVLVPERPYRALFSRRLRSAVTVAGPFWVAYFDGVIRRLDKAALASRVTLASEFLQTELSPSRSVDRVLIMYSDEDPLMPASSVAELSQLYPGAQHYVFEGTGHSAPLLRPKEYLRVMKTFLMGGAF